MREVAREFCCGAHNHLIRARHAAKKGIEVLTGAIYTCQLLENKIWVMVGCPYIILYTYLVVHPHKQMKNFDQSAPPSLTYPNLIAIYKA